MRKARNNKRRPVDSGNLRRLYVILGSLAGITIFIIFFVIGDYGLYQVYQIHKQRKALENNLVELKAEQDSLLQEKNRLEKDLTYIEKLARERYRMAKKGEKVFRVIERQVSPN